MLQVLSHAIAIIIREKEAKKKNETEGEFGIVNRISKQRVNLVV